MAKHGTVRRRLVKVLQRAHAAMLEGKPAADFVDDVLAEALEANVQCDICHAKLERRRGNVMPCPKCVGCTVDEAHEVLSALTKADPEAMLRLIETKVTLRPGKGGIVERFADAPAPSPGAVIIGRWVHPNGTPWAGWDTLGFVGLLNGMMGLGGERLAAIVEERDGRLQLLGWEVVDETTGKPR